MQKIFTHFKRTPGTHKLGVLYVIDSVTRQWIERAGVSGQDISSVNSPDGTFAAGVRRVTELLPVLMNDLIQTAPDDQKVSSTFVQTETARPSNVTANCTDDMLACTVIFGS